MMSFNVNRSVRSSNILLLAVLFLIVRGPATAQNDELRLDVAPDKSDWTYKLNERAKFIVSVTNGGQPVSGVPLKYKCGSEFLPATIEKSVISSSGDLVIEAGTMREPGFLRCTVSAEKNGKNYRALAAAGFEPERIKPTATDPVDFNEFWDSGKAELAKIPIDAKVEPLTLYKTPTVDVFHVSFRNVGRIAGGAPTRIYGILAVPKVASSAAKFPAVLSLPGAGVRPYRGLIRLAERGIMTLQIGIHGIPVNLSDEIYDDLAIGALNRYMLDGIEDKNEYYYRRVFLGCLRANDFLTSLPQYDGRNLAVMGGSQGGALAIATAALDSRVIGQAAWLPALADLTGYLFNRAGGWPPVFKQPSNRTAEKIATSKYFDTVNFARRLRTPGFYTFGYRDEICPPTSMFAAYNTIGAPKELLIEKETGHAINEKQRNRIDEWVMSLLKTKRSP
jgi:cephalosporin-C deacetylase